MIGIDMSVGRLLDYVAVAFLDMLAGGSCALVKGR